MSLPLRQQWALKRTEYSLRRSDPDFATIMHSFALFAADGRSRPREQVMPVTRCGLRVVLGVLMHIVLAVANSAAVAGSALARRGARIWACARHALARSRDAGVPAQAGAEQRR